MTVKPGQELTALAQFRAVRLRGTGIVVISDDEHPREPIAHHAECSFVTEAGFREKVLDDSGANGRYWWFKRFDAAAEALGSRRCRHCA